MEDIGLPHFNMFQPRRLMKRNARQQIKALWMGLLALGAWQGGSVWAQGAPNCTLASNPLTYDVTQVAGRDVVVDPSLPLGQPLGREGSRVISAGDWRFNCVTDNNPVRIEHTFLAGSVGSDGVYPLKVGGVDAGVGLKIFISNGGRPREQVPSFERRSVPRGIFTEVTEITTSLVRYGGAVVYGPVDTGANLVRGMLYNESGPPQSFPFRTIRLGYFNLVRPSCRIDTTSLNQTVRLGNHNVGDFANGTPSAWEYFDLVVDQCDDPDMLADITFGTPADADPSHGDLFSMNQDGPQGLGIAIAKEGASSPDMLPGRLQEFPNPGTGNSFRFQARLQPTIGQVTAGEINRPVTVLVNFK